MKMATVITLARNKLTRLQGEFPNINTTLSKITGFVRGNPIVSTAIVGITTAGVTAGLVKRITKRRKKKVTRKKATKRKSKKRSYTKKKRKRGIRYTPRTAGKRRDTSTRRIRQTKHGQPYIILKSGKARFIKKSSARRSRRLKGGKY